MRYLDPQLFLQQRFKDRVKPKWRAAVICFRDLRGSGALVKRLGAVPVSQRVLSGMDYPGDRPYVYEARINGSPVCVVSGCWWGGPQAAMLVEELSCLGVEYVIGFGAAGSICHELPKHAQIVASLGLVTDGTSRAYTKADSVGPDPGLLETLRLLQGRLNHKVVEATIATVDAIYQETPEAVREWAGLGAQAINMETTPLYAVARQCGVKSLWLGYVSDCLLGDEWDDWWDIPGSLDEASADIAAAFLETLMHRGKLIADSCLP